MQHVQLKHVHVKARVLWRFVIKMRLRASGDNENIGKGTITKSSTQILDTYLHFHCKSKAVVIALHTSAPENAPFQCQDFQKVHAVIRKVGSSSGGTTEDTHQQLFLPKENTSSSQVHCFTAAQHSPCKPIHQATMWSCKPKNIGEWKLSLCTLASGTCTQQHDWGHPCFPRCSEAVWAALAINCHWPLARQTDLCFVILIDRIA